MKNSYPVKKRKFSTKRALMDVLEYGQPQLAAERDKSEKIRSQFEKHGLASPARSEQPINPKLPVFKGQYNKISYLPWKSFGWFSRADLGAGTFQQISGISPRNTTG